MQSGFYKIEALKLRQNQENDRPWAAWLYGSIGLATLTDNHLDELEFTAGVVGPQALGEQTQKLIHNHVTPGERLPTLSEIGDREIHNPP